MHDLLIALAFVSMVISPAIVAAWPKQEEDLEADLRAPAAKVEFLDRQLPQLPAPKGQKSRI
jgi:hypothetical protein